MVVFKRTSTMQQTQAQIGDVVPPSCQRLQAASSESEISRSRGGPGPNSSDYPMCGPFCNSSGALAVAAMSDEHHTRPLQLRLIP
jgi:hypothetical protein